MRDESQSRLKIVLVLTFLYMLIDAGAAYYTGSLALLADTFHMASDLGALALALVAIWLAKRSPTDGKTYGYYRSEILAGLINGVVLVGLCFYILFEAWRRLSHPPEVLSGPMLAVALVGLVLNLVSVKLLGGMSGHSVNVKAAYLEVLGDLLATIGVIIASVIMITTKWYMADPIISGLIGFLILPRTWILLSECVNILMEGTPGYIDIGKLREAMLAVPGVVELHDIHAWTITSGMDAMSCHVTTNKDANQDAILAELTDIVQKQFNINHTTIQVEQIECKGLGNGTCH
jgi:cobalt-zinc-cadmium efflux system protein